MTDCRFARLPRPPRSVAVGLAFGLTAFAAPVVARGEPAAPSVYARAGAGGPTPAATAESPAVQAERILASALLAFDRVPSVRIDFRQKTRIGNRVLVGSGRYLQSGNGEEQRFRFESILNADTETFETIEVCDGVNGWSYRRLGADPARLERLNVRRVRERLAQFGFPGESSVSPYLGGLQRSLWLARQWFRFQSATAAELDGLQVWVIEGTWYPETLAEIAPTLKEACSRPGGVVPEELPDGMPSGIRFTIARSDLLPRRVEYLAIPGPRPVTARSPEPIAVLELLDIRVGEPVDASAFIYRPQLGRSDFTDSYVAGLSPMRP